MSKYVDFKGYRVLRIALNISGIVIFQRPLKSITGKISMYVLPFLFHMFSLYITCVNLYLIMRNKVQIEVLLSQTVTGIISIVLWHNVRQKRFCIRKLITSMHDISLLQSKQKSNHESVINFLITLFTLITMSSAVSCTIFVSEPNFRYTDYYAFYVNVSDGIDIFLRVIFCQLLFAMVYLQPAVIALLCSAVYYKCGDLIGYLCKDLEVFLKRTPHQRDIKKLMIVHKLLLRTSVDIENVLSSTSLLLLCSQVFCVYVGLFALIIIPKKNLFTPILMECISSLSLGPIALISVIISASKISTQSERMWGVLQLMHSNCLENANVEKETMVLLKAMLNAVFPTMTAYHLMELKPGLILSIFGSMLTYALLVLSIEFSNFYSEKNLSI